MKRFFVAALAVAWGLGIASLSFAGNTQDETTFTISVIVSDAK